MEVNRFYIELTGLELSDIEFENETTVWDKLNLIEFGDWTIEYDEQWREIIVESKENNQFYMISISRRGTSAGGYNYSFYNNWRTDEEKTFRFPRVIPEEETHTVWHVLR